MVWLDWIKKSTNTRYVNMQLDIDKCINTFKTAMVITRVMNVISENNVVMTNFVCHACNAYIYTYPEKRTASNARCIQ